MLFSISNGLVMNKENETIKQVNSFACRSADLHQTPPDPQHIETVM